MQTQFSLLYDYY